MERQMPKYISYATRTGRVGEIDVLLSVLGPIRHAGGEGRGT